MKQVRLGIIGIGNMGTAHARSILEGKCPEIALAAGTDMSEARRAWAKDNLPAEVAVFDTVEDMLDSGRIDAALIASPHYLHPVHATACFARHIHALVEKPAAVSAARARAMNEAAQKSGVVFGIMLNQRANRVYQTMRQVVKSGELGAIRRTNWAATNWYRPQAYFDSGAWRGTWSGEARSQDHPDGRCGAALPRHVAGHVRAPRQGGDRGREDGCHPRHEGRSGRVLLLEHGAPMGEARPKG